MVQEKNTVYHWKIYTGLAGDQNKERHFLESFLVTAPLNVQKEIKR